MPSAHTLLAALLVGSPAAAGPGEGDEGCRGRLSAEAFRAATERALEHLSAGEEEAVSELGRLMSRLSCVDGPLYEDDLGRLYLARAISLYGRDRGRALDLLRWAANLGADWPEGFGSGDNMQRAYSATRDAVGATGTLLVDPPGEADVLLLDGWVVEPGAHSVAYGAHLIQWRDPEGWHGKWLVVGSAQSARLTFPPAPGPPAPSWGVLYGGMYFYRGDIYDGYRRWDGRGQTPAVRAEGHLVLGGAWGLDAAARLGSGASAERPPMVTGVDARGSYRLGERTWASLGLGLRGTVLPAVEPGLAADSAPSFVESGRLGAAAVLTAGSSDGPVSLGLDLAAAGYGVGWEAWGGLFGRLSTPGPDPQVRLSMGTLGVDAAWGRQSRYTWYSVELGVRWQQR